MGALVRIWQSLLHSMQQGKGVTVIINEEVL
jgi:hypothetical protein